MERLNDGGYRDDWYDEEYDQDDNEGHDQEYDQDDNEGHDQGYGEDGNEGHDQGDDEGYSGEAHEEIEHWTDFAADGSLDDDTEYGPEDWRNKRRRGQRGRFEPPDTTKFKAPVFVRVADL